MIYLFRIWITRSKNNIRDEFYSQWLTRWKTLSCLEKPNIQPDASAAQQLLYPCPPCFQRVRWVRRQPWHEGHWWWRLKRSRAKSTNSSFAQYRRITSDTCSKLAQVAQQCHCEKVTNDYGFSYGWASWPTGKFLLRVRILDLTILRDASYVLKEPRRLLAVILTPQTAIKFVNHAYAFATFMSYPKLPIIPNMCYFLSNPRSPSPKYLQWLQNIEWLRGLLVALKTGVSIFLFINVASKLYYVYGIIGQSKF